MSVLRKVLQFMTPNQRQKESPTQGQINGYLARIDNYSEKPRSFCDISRANLGDPFIDRSKSMVETLKKGQNLGEELIYAMKRSNMYLPGLYESYYGSVQISGQCPHCGAMIHRSFGCKYC